MIRALLACTALIGGCASVPVPTEGSAQVADLLYADPAKWLCLPGRDDACTQDMTTTVVQADGRTSREMFRPQRNPPVDCFYVYPTLSLDAAGNADWQAGPEESRVLEQQIVRFKDVCRVFVPQYRQITLAGTTGKYGPIAPLYSLAVGDVYQAWGYYLAHHNRGRGVILIGHSQGSRMLTDLIKNKIDGQPSQARVVAAYLNGTSIEVPQGQQVGGTFKHMPLCRTASQTGCVVAYRSFRETLPPINSYAATSTPGMEIACVNPAAPGGGKAPLHAYLSTRPMMNGPKPQFVNGKQVTTPFASVPGLLTAECTSNEKGQYLAIRIKADPADPRTDDITGDIYAGDAINPAMGLHLIDINLTMGNLLQLARSQSGAWLARQ